MDAEIRTVAVLGAGNGGCAVAADLARRGYRVRVFSRSATTVAPIVERAGIEYLGEIGEGFAPVELATDDLARAVVGADLVLLTVPTSALPYFARGLASLVGAEQVIMLNPGHVCGGLYLFNELRRLGNRTLPCVCEVNTLSHASRLLGPARVRVIHLVRNLLFAAFPGRYSLQQAGLIEPLFPNIRLACNVLETAFHDVNAIEHPPQILCNAGWVEHTAGGYDFYTDGTTPSVGRVIDAVDAERMAIAARLGIPAKSFVQYFWESGYTSERAVRVGRAYEALKDSEPNRGVKGPRSLDHRYVHEDVGWGLVPLVALGQAAGIATPVMDALITLASVMNGLDYRREGLTLERMGLEANALADLPRYLEVGPEKGER